MSSAKFRAAIGDIRETADRMARSAKFKVIFEEYPAMTSDDIKAWEGEIRIKILQEKFSIPESIVDFYHISGGFQFQWQNIDTDELVTGSSCIVTLMELYQRDDEIDFSMEDCLKKSRSFDMISPDDETVFDFSGKLFEHFQISVVEKDSKKIHHLQIGLVNYIANLAKFRAIYRWQDIFTAQDTVTSNNALLERLNTYLSGI